MKSRNVWVIAIAIMKIRRVVVEKVWVAAKERTKIATRLMWIPGIRPVRVPAKTPKISGTANANIFWKDFIVIKDYCVCKSLLSFFVSLEYEDFVRGLW